MMSRLSYSSHAQWFACSSYILSADFTHILDQFSHTIDLGRTAPLRETLFETPSQRSLSTPTQWPRWPLGPWSQYSLSSSQVASTSHQPVTRRAWGIFRMLDAWTGLEWILQLGIVDSRNLAAAALESVSISWMCVKRIDILPSWSIVWFVRFVIQIFVEAVVARTRHVH